MNNKASNPISTPVMPELNARARQVLADVVESYGASGEPVGSKMLVESGKYQLSGASLRNVMADLEEMGLLTHPHTSAGRVPTEVGYKFYAQHLITTEEPTDVIKKALAEQLNPSQSLNTVVQNLGQTVSSITNCAALITVPKREQDLLEHMDFVRLSGDRVLVIMITGSGEIENRMIEVPPFISAEDLQKAALTLKPVVVGHTLDDARAMMVQALAEQKGAVNTMIDQMMKAAHEWGRPVTADGAMVVAGSTNLFQYPELVRDQLQKMVKLFEEKRLLMALVEEVRKGDGVKIFVGSDVPLQDAKDYSVVAGNYGRKGDDKLMGAIGVIGPQRMNYKHTLSVVNYTSQRLSKFLNEGK